MKLSDSILSTAQSLQETADKLQAKADEMNAFHTQQVACPRCHSTDFSVSRKHISRTGMLLGGPLFGISNKTEAVCHKCGKHFNI